MRSQIEQFRAELSSDTPPDTEAFQQLVAAARQVGMLQDMGLVAANVYREWQHPRGLDGEWINTIGTLLNVFGGFPHGPNDKSLPRRRAKVLKFTPEGVHVAYFDTHGRLIPADPARMFPEIIPVNQFRRRIMLAPTPLAHLELTSKYEGPGIQLAIRRLDRAMGDWKALTPEERDQRWPEVNDLANKIISQVPVDNPDQLPYIPRYADTPAIADKQLEGARAQEKTITPALQDIAATLGGELSGLNNRTKSRDSLMRKIESDAAWYGITPDKVPTHDVLRYTFVGDHRLKSQYAQTVEKMKAAGWDVSFVNDTFPAPKGTVSYRGINARFTKDGFTFEMQFHTKESLAVKALNHRDYKFERDPEAPVGLVMVMTERMIRRSDGITLPDGYTQL